MVPPVNPGSGSPTPARHSRRRWFTPRVRRALALGIGGLFVLGCAVVLAAWLTVCMGDACPSVEHLDDYDPVQAAKDFIEGHNLSWTAWCADNLWGPFMFAEDWKLLTGAGEMGGFARKWLEDTKDRDQPQKQP